MLVFVAVRYYLITLALLVAANIFAANVNAQFVPRQPCPSELSTGFDSISIDKIQSHVSILAGKNFAGRGTGQQGYKKAAHWVAGKLAEIGIEPIYADGSYFQSVPLQQRLPILEECYLRAAGGVKISAQDNIGFDTYSSKPSVLGRLIFIRCPKSRFKVPADLVLRDTIIIYWVDDSSYKYASRKIESHQPAAMFRVIQQKPKSVNQPTFDGQIQTAIKGSISAKAAQELITATTRRANPASTNSGGQNSDGEGLWNRAGEGDAELAFLDPRSSVALANPFRVRKITAPNVIGILPGSDPTLRHQHIIIGAHLDHIGISSNDVLYGADDNASGCSALLSVAEALVKNPVRPKRSIVFAFFAAEEVGLLGSEYYCQRPILPLRNLTCMLNIDMVGRNESSIKETADENKNTIHLIGARQGGSDLHEVILKANQHIGFRFEMDEEKIFDRSDQFNFFRKGVGVAFLFGGFHPDYHLPSDRIESLNYKKIQAAARLYYLTAFKADQHGPFPVTVPDLKQLKEQLKQLQQGNE